MIIAMIETQSVRIEGKSNIAAIPVIPNYLLLNKNSHSTCMKMPATRSIYAKSLSPNRNTRIAPRNSIEGGLLAINFIMTLI